MKRFIKILFGSLTVLTFAQCGSSQVLETEPPFALDTSHMEPWTAGDANQFSGMNLLFPVKSGKDVLLDSVYFRNTMAPLIRIQKNSYLVYKATIDTTEAPYDVIMHADPKEEVGNRPSDVKRSPFVLKHDEAVITYMDNGQRKYYKVTGLHTSPAVHYRERPKVKN